MASDRAVLYGDYGGREQLKLGELPASSPGKGELLVRVEAASINPVDGKVRRGELKLLAGGHFPKVPGLDFAGVVEAVGPGSTGFSPGDPVFGVTGSMGGGAMAERAVVKAAGVARRPAGLSPVQAASVPVVAAAALQVLRDLLGLEKGQRVLVNGCTGGVGLFALQLARRMGVQAVGVCGTEGVELARRFGAVQVVDYKKQKVTEAEGPFHALLELSGKLPFEAAHPLLGEHGIYVDFSPTPGGLIGNTLANPFRAHKHKFALTGATTRDLEELASLLGSGALELPPLQTFPFERFREAFALAESGGVIGKVVVQIG